MKTITVRFSKAKLDHLEHNIHIGYHVMAELQAALIPVRGNLTITWLEDGELTVIAKPDELVYVWKGEHPLVAKKVEEEESIW